MRSHDPDAVLLNLLAVDEILFDNLHELTGVVIDAERRRGPRLCAIAIRLNTTLVSINGTPVHSFEMPGLLTCGSDRGFCLRYLELSLEDMAAEPEGQPPVYFPNGTLDARPELHGPMAAWFSKCLWRMGEPSLVDLARYQDYHGYRFLWLRTFDEPVSVRLEIDQVGTGVLTSKKTSGQGGYSPGRLIDARSHSLSRQPVNAFLELLEKARFWKSRAAPDDRGLDGAEWIIEGAKSGSYHVAHQWCPKEGPFRDAALFLIGHSEIDVGRIY
jgi:hypothetical protein